MTDAVGWTAVVMAIAAMIRGELSAYTARKGAREKAEGERLAARDKMEFDADLQNLRAASAECAADRDEMRALLKKCSEQHAESERDRAEMKGRLSVMERMLSAQVKIGAAAQ